jgi:hypothetical protein
MEVIPDFTKKTMTSFLQRNVATGSTIYTGGLKSFDPSVTYSSGPSVLTTV